MSLSYRSFILLLFPLCFTQCNGGFKTMGLKRKPGKADELYSESNKKPFKYGYAFTLEECKRYSFLIEQMGLKKGDVVADVGAASGYIDGAMSVICDSVTFYIEDINQVFLNKEELNKMVNYFSKVKQSPQTNNFHFTIGTERKTNLPNGIFDKVLVYNAFHEFTYVGDMINDMYKKLKPNGQLIIFDKFAYNNVPVISRGCYVAAYEAKEITEMMKFHGLYLTKMSYPDGAYDNILIFEKDKKRSDNYLIKKVKVDSCVKILNPLDSISSIAGDSLKTSIIGDSLMYNLSEINEIYPYLESWINTIGYDWINKKLYLQAINVLKLNVLLYPGSSNVYDSLGEAYMGNKQYALALFYYTKSLELDPNNISGKERISKLKKMMEN